jgi:hypothetical protein
MERGSRKDASNKFTFSLLVRQKEILPRRKESDFFIHDFSLHVDQN